MATTKRRKNNKNSPDLVSFLIQVIFQMILAAFASKSKQQNDYVPSTPKQVYVPEQVVLIESRPKPTSMFQGSTMIAYTSNETIQYIVDKFGDAIIGCASVDDISFISLEVQSTCTKLSPIQVPNNVSGADIARETARWLKSAV